MMSSLFRCGAILCLLVAACGSDDDASANAGPAAPSTAAQLSTPKARCVVDDNTADLEKHACLHAEKGPFATAKSTRTGAAAGISKAHTAYDIEVDGAASWVSFRAKGSGKHAFYSRPKTRLVLQGAGGRTIEPLCEGETTGACRELPYAVHAELVAGEDVLVALFPDGSATSTRLVIEDIEF